MNKYIKDMSLDGLHFELVNMLHRVKYNTEEYVDWLYKIELDNLKSMSKNQFRNLCIAATFVQIAYEKRGDMPPNWVLDKRLHMDKAYVSRYADYLDIFEAYQAEYDHNVFYNKTAYEVI